jgi:hypothetical protein
MGYGAREGSEKPSSAIRFLRHVRPHDAAAILSEQTTCQQGASVQAPPADAITPKESMVKEALRDDFPILIERPPRVHDAGLVTADRPGGGFCANCPETKLRRREKTVPAYLFGKSQFAGSRSRWRTQPASRSFEFFNKIMLLSSTPHGSGRDRGRRSPPTRCSGRRSHEIQRFYQLANSRWRPGALQMPAVRSATEEALRLVSESSRWLRPSRMTRRHEIATTRPLTHEDIAPRQPSGDERLAPAPCRGTKPGERTTGDLKLGNDGSLLQIKRFVWCMLLSAGNRGVARAG